MARHIAVGIDVGTSQVKVVVAEEVLLSSASNESEKLVPKIIGIGLSESKGLHHGYIVNIAEASRCIQAAVNEAEKAAKMKIKRAFVAIGGVGLGSTITTGSVIISRADLEVTARDMNLALEAAEAAIPAAVSLNRKIINTIPIEWKVDSKVAWGRVEGLRAQKIEVKALFITCFEHHLQDLIRAVEGANIEVIDVVAAPIAASFVTLSKKQKKAGCLLANIGSESLSIVVFENSNPISLEVFPIGGTDITNDIALGLKVSLEEAESIKLGNITKSIFSKKRLGEIISARLSDCFELVESHLKKIGRNALLPAGIIITGGGAKLASVREFAESALKLPSKIADVHFGEDDKGGVKDPVWTVSCGLSIVGFNAEDEQRSVGGRGVDKIREGGKKSLVRALDWFSQFLP